MPKLEWNVNFILGIQEIDEHHKYLFDLINSAYDKFTGGESIGLSVIAELVDYADYHFTCEERWMVETSYSSFKEHKEEHDHFVRLVSAFVEELLNDKDDSLELLAFVSNWIAHHILETDAKFGRYLDVQQIGKHKPLQNS
jgi:hemerythrin